MEDNGQIRIAGVESPAPKEVGQPKGVLDGAPTNYYEVKAIAEVLGLDEMGVDAHQSKIATLLEWAKARVELPTPDNLKWELRKLQDKIGTPPINEKWVTYLTRYAFLDMEEKKIAEEKSKYLQRTYATN